MYKSGSFHSIWTYALALTYSQTTCHIADTKPTEFDFSCGKNKTRFIRCVFGLGRTNVVKTDELNYAITMAAAKMVETITISIDSIATNEQMPLTYKHRKEFHREILWKSGTSEQHKRWKTKNQKKKKPSNSKYIKENDGTRTNTQQDEVEETHLHTDTQPDRKKHSTTQLAAY